MCLLLAGGRADPNLAALRVAAAATGRAVLCVAAGPEAVAEIAFDPATGTLHLDGAAVSGVAGAFLRADVFGKGPPRARAHAAAVIAVLQGWLAASPAIRRFNADPFGRSRSVNKPAALAAAGRAGLPLPRTMAGNSRAALVGSMPEDLVQKPVTGGDFCKPLPRDLIARYTGPGLPNAVIAQERLTPPELRVFRIGPHLMGFRVASDALDYRTDRAARIEPAEVPADLAAPLLRLTDAMGLDWCASDFKFSPDQGCLVYLETNANPMFAGFDRASDGALCRAMLDSLLRRD